MFARFHTRLIGATVGGAVLAGGAMAPAQTYESDTTYRSSGQQTQYDQEQSGQQRDIQQQRTPPRFGQQQRTPPRFGQQQPAQGATWTLEPESWVFIGYDTDQDGELDSYEYVWAGDLERARRASHQRETRMAPPPGRRHLFGRMLRSRRGGRFPRAEQVERVSGTLEDIKSVRLIGMREPHAIAKIRTDEGRTAKVDLGPKSRIETLGLSQGEQLTITGRRGTINDKVMLMANELQTSSRTVSIDRPGRMGQRLQRVRGEIIDRETATIRQTGQQHVIATLRTRQGRTVKVDLGPQSQHPSGVDLNRGEYIAVLAERGRLNQQPALFAKQVRVQDGRSFAISRPQTQQYQQAGDIEVQTQQQQRQQQQREQQQQQPYQQSQTDRERRLQQREQELQRREQQLRQREQQLQQREQQTSPQQTP